MLNCISYNLTLTLWHYPLSSVAIISQREREREREREKERVVCLTLIAFWLSWLVSYSMSLPRMAVGWSVIVVFPGDVHYKSK